MRSKLSVAEQRAWAAGSMPHHGKVKGLEAEFWFDDQRPLDGDTRMTDRDEQLDVIDQEIRRLERRIQELHHSKAQIRRERAEHSHCEICGKHTHPRMTVCWSCAKEVYL